MDNINSQEIKDRIIKLLEDNLPLVDPEADFLYKELDSLGIVTIQMVLADTFGIELTSKDATPKHLRNVDTLTAQVVEKLQEKN